MVIVVLAKLWVFVEIGPVLLAMVAVMLSPVQPVRPLTVTFMLTLLDVELETVGSSACEKYTAGAQ